MGCMGLINRGSNVGPRLTHPSIGASNKTPAEVRGNRNIMITTQVAGATNPAGERPVRWLILLCLLVSSICSGISQISFSTIIGDVSHDLGISLGVASFGLFGIMIFVTALGMCLSGFVLDRVGVFTILLVSQAIFILSFLLLPVLGQHFPALVALRVLQGLAAAGVAVSVTPAVASWFPDREMGRAMGIQAMGMPIGMMVGLLATPRLVEATGHWQSGLACLSALGFVALGLTLFVVRMAGPGLLARPDRLPGHEAHGAPSMAAVFTMPEFWGGLIISAILFGTGFTFNDLAPGFLAVAPPVGAGYGPEAAGKLMSVNVLMGLGAPLLAGFMVDKLFGGRSKPVIVLGWLLSLLMPSVLLSFVHGSQAALLPVLIVGGLANPFIAITLMSFAAKTFPVAVVGRVAGLWLSVSFFAAAFCTMGGSLVLHGTGGYAWPIALTGIGSVIGLVVSVLLKFEPRKVEA